MPQVLEENTSLVEQTEDIERRVEQARKWIDTPEGLEAIQAGREMAQQAVEQFRRSLIVDPSTLKRPFTL